MRYCRVLVHVPAANTKLFRHPTSACLQHVLLPSLMIVCTTQTGPHYCSSEKCRQHTLSLNASALGRVWSRVLAMLQCAGFDTADCRHCIRPITPSYTFGTNATCHIGEAAAQAEISITCRHDKPLHLSAPKHTEAEDSLRVRLMLKFSLINVVACYRME